MADPTTTSPAVDERKKMLACIARRLPAYCNYRNYYEGKHRIAYSTDKWRNAFGQVLKKFSDNLCPSVVDAVADRLDLTGFFPTKEGEQKLTAPKGQKLPDDISKRVDEIVDMVTEVWDCNQMDERSGAVHQEALTLGDAYCVVWPDEDGEPCIYPQITEAMTVCHDTERPGKLLWAVKLWQMDDGRMRLTAYYPDRIEKYVTIKAAKQLPDKVSDFTQWNEPGEPWPLPNPYDRVPVFHFKTNPGVNCFGRSELMTAIPIQDALNKTVMDLLVAGEFVALPQRFVTGLEVETDDLTGKPKIPFQPGVDRIWQAASPDVKFGELGGADLTHFIAVADQFRTEIARVTGTPLHYFMLMTDPPSGVALRALEARFIKRVRDRQISFGNVWEELLSFCLEILERPGVRLRSEWKPAELVDEKLHAETLILKQQIGVSRKQLLREMGYDEVTIEQMQQEKEEEQTEQAELGDELLKKFGAGQAGGQGPANYGGGTKPKPTAGGNSNAGGK